MAPGLPFLTRSAMKSSLRVVPASFGPLPAARPPLWWQKPHEVANIVSPSMSTLSGAWPCCAPTPMDDAIARPAMRMIDVAIRIGMAAGRPVRRRGQLEVGADVELRHRFGDWRGLHHLYVHAPFLRDLVPEAGFRAVGARVPADAAGDRRAERRARSAE